MAVQTSEGDPPAEEEAAAVEAIKRLGGIVERTEEGWEVAFHLRGQDVTDSDLQRVAVLDDVISLNLRGTRITSAGLRHLAGLTALRRLHLEQTRVDDSGIEHLSRLTRLEYLNLYETQISDAALEKLKGLSKLKRLYVWQTDVTLDGATKLEKRLPGLKVIRGVDLDNLPTFAEVAADVPMPKVDLTWMAVSRRAEVPKSTNGLNTQVLFENRSEQTVKVYWVSYGNELKLYAELKPGAQRQQNTYANNTWLITDTDEGPLGYFQVGEEFARAVIPERDE